MVLVKLITGIITKNQQHVSVKKIRSLL